MKYWKKLTERREPSLASPPPEIKPLYKIIEVNYDSMSRDDLIEVCRLRDLEIYALNSVNRQRDDLVKATNEAVAELHKRLNAYEDLELASACDQLRMKCESLQEKVDFLTDKRLSLLGENYALMRRLEKVKDAE